MSLPVVAIVGRPNVGKSSLLNCLAGRRVSIVDPTPGVTRDRISSVVALPEGYAEVIDTGGFGIADADNLTERVTEQIDFAIASADLALFLVDAREGVLPLDKAVAQRLRRHDKPVLLVANKVDSERAALEIAELNALGFGEPLAVSATHRRGISALIEALAERLGRPAPMPQDPVMKIALVGKRNVGKSTFINALAGASRVIVSETPGTTRDSVDVSFQLDGRPLVAIDTAGVRKRARLADDVEYYSRHRALRSIRRADVVLFLLDAVARVGRVDRQLLDYIAQEFKPMVLVVNKWDLAADKADRSDFEPYLTRAIPELSYVPIVFTTATASQGVREAVGLARELFEQSRRRVPTAELNEAIAKITAHHTPKAVASTHRAAKILYATQIGTAPPTIVCFVNNVEAFDAAYRKYMLNQFRLLLPFPEVPIRLLLRPRRRDD